ncbi:hypothetical protein [Haloferax volcanii]|uniref:hypothetical protein n=1 Tax=Haloferax volcanii TaxID=2246 RepID=UPI00249B0996|nr:hypothetical protein [Haloferax alexandrinus]WEL29840.1 hypothetical protein HBNXHx_1734 [Haloferax alexandrinus]
MIEISYETSDRSKTEEFAEDDVAIHHKIGVEIFEDETTRFVPINRVYEIVEDTSRAERDTSSEKSGSGVSHY